MNYVKIMIVNVKHSRKPTQKNIRTNSMIECYSQNKQNSIFSLYFIGIYDIIITYQ